MGGSQQGGGASTGKKNLTMFDVRQLLIDGEKDMAIEVYRELFKTSREDARRAVEEINQSIRSKGL